MSEAAVITTPRIIHLGKGKVMLVQDQVIPDRTEALPPKPQRLLLKRETTIKWPAVRSHTNYKPGPITDMGFDQCRFTVIDENSVVCGAKTKAGTSWCPEHAKRVHGRSA